MASRDEPGKSRIRRAARQRLGYDNLRPGQEEAARAILEGRDAMVIMPTGGGKSAIYQIAGFLIPGVTLVISPLIALQQDQVEALENRYVGEAAALNSTLSAAQREEIFERLASGGLEFLFLAPEQLTNKDTLRRLQAVKPSLVVVDEAHCVSQWGYDFRPDYLRLGEAIEALGHPRTLALTATASPPVRQEIADQLGMVNPCVVISDLDRPNLWLGVETHHDEDTKLEALLERVSRAAKPGIIYVATRKDAERLAQAVNELGVKAGFYHGGMQAPERESAQDNFMGDELEVMVATIAFGMGLDKANVRFVFHYHISDSVDSYYHEIGRAGRDGSPAEAILFYRIEDLGIRRFFAATGRIEREDVELALDSLKAGGGYLQESNLKEATGLSQVKLNRTLDALESGGLIERPGVDGVVRLLQVGESEDIENGVATARARQQFDQSQLEMMRGYAESRVCRREYLLSYFGGDFRGPCDRCDNCQQGGALITELQDTPFPVHARIVHKEWGAGVIQRYEEDKMVVLFDSSGYKVLATELVVDQELIRPLGESDQPSAAIGA